MAALQDGFKTLIGLANVPAVKFYEKEVTPPSVSGGGANEQTTMRNTAYRTQGPKKLKTIGDIKAKVSYDAAVITDILAQINVNQLITVTYPDNSTLAVWGWLDEFTPGNNVEGQQPMADITIKVSNLNASGVETAPAYTP